MNDTPTVTLPPKPVVLPRLPRKAEPIHKPQLVANATTHTTSQKTQPVALNKTLIQPVASPTHTLPDNTPRQNPPTSPHLKNTLHWHWMALPLENGYGLPTSDVIVKLTSKEKFTKYNQAKAEKEGSTHTGTPEIGDARRFYEKGSHRYITALLINSKDTPTNIENLQLALCNLHCQMETLAATQVHIQIAPKAFKPLKTMEAILAIEKQFHQSEIQVHLWIPEQHSKIKDNLSLKN